jgi:hypothetical protein
VAREESILGTFVHVDDLLLALRRLTSAGHSIKTVFSPLPLPEVQQIVGARPSPVRPIVLLGAVAGGLGLLSLAVYAHLSFGLITGGKPVLPWVPWVVVCFEGSILGGVVFGAIGWILKGRLPRLSPPPGYEGAFSRNRFGVLVACPFGETESVERALREEGAEEVRRVS